MVLLRRDRFIEHFADPADGAVFLDRSGKNTVEPHRLPFERAPADGSPITVPLISKEMSVSLSVMFTGENAAATSTASRIAFCVSVCGTKNYRKLYIPSLDNR